MMETDPDAYSDIRIRKVKILRGPAREAAVAAHADEEDLVILKTSRYHSQPTYEVEIIKGDPTAYLTKVKKA